MRVVLISTYDLGHQPFGLASPAAWLRADGHEITTADLTRESFPLDAIRAADWVAFYLPMHTAARLALPKIGIARELNPKARICCYGLYAPLNDAVLRDAGGAHIIGGEFEKALADLISGRAEAAFSVVLDRLIFRTPDRAGLPALDRYAKLVSSVDRSRAETRIAGYTEASRGCKHLCRHCPIVPVYNGRFRIVQREVVLADVRSQAAAGAQHITFGDPDFFNGPAHAIAIVNALHEEFPNLTYDVTIKVGHLLRHRDLLPILARTGCLFVTSAVESLDDAVLMRLAKGHTGADFLEALQLTRASGLNLAPTFVAFTPWTTREAYLDLLRTIRDLDLIGSVAPIQLAIRLLIPAGSKLLELEDLAVGPFDREALSYRWKHPDPEMDRLCSDLMKLIRDSDRRRLSRSETFEAIWTRVFERPPDFHLTDRSAIPYLTEPWYC